MCLPRPLLLLNFFTVLSFLVPPTDDASVGSSRLEVDDSVYRLLWLSLLERGLFLAFGGVEAGNAARQTSCMPHKTGLSLKRQLSGWIVAMLKLRKYLSVSLDVIYI